MPTFHVFQHVPHENLGALEPLFQASHFAIAYHKGYEQDLSQLKLADCKDAAGFIVMGGPMSANDEAKYAFIREELRLIEEALTLNLPLLGICLGSQLLAKVLGARVYPGKQKEIGWYPLRMDPCAAQDPIFATFPAQFEIFQWHGETFDLPKEARLLASSELYPHQAFRYRKAYGLQFHPEMTFPMIEEWLREGKKEIESASLPHSIEQILNRSPECLQKVFPLLQNFVQGFIGS